MKHWRGAVPKHLFLPFLEYPFLRHTLGELCVVHSHRTELSELSLWWPLPFIGFCSCSLLHLVPCFLQPVLLTRVHTSLTLVNGARLPFLVWYKPIVLSTKLTHCCIVISDFTEELEAVNGTETPDEKYCNLDHSCDYFSCLSIKHFRSILISWICFPFLLHFPPA